MSSDNRLDNVTNYRPRAHPMHINNFTPGLQIDSTIIMPTFHAPSAVHHAASIEQTSLQANSRNTFGENRRAGGNMVMSSNGTNSGIDDTVRTDDTDVAMVLETNTASGQIQTRSSTTHSAKHRKRAHLKPKPKFTSVAKRKHIGNKKSKKNKATANTNIGNRWVRVLRLRLAKGL